MPLRQLQGNVRRLVDDDLLRPWLDLLWLRLHHDDAVPMITAARRYGAGGVVDVPGIADALKR